jgi:RNA polymerase sigma factor, sigma-70 family
MNCSTPKSTEQLNTTAHLRSNDTAQEESKRLTTPADIEALRRGDTDAYDKIYRAWFKPILNTLAKLTGSDVEAEDIAQNVFTDLWLTREKLDPEKRLNTYLYTLARHAAVDYFRRRRVAGEYFETLDWDEMSQASSDDLIIEKEVKLLKDMALSLMPATQRDIYKLSHEEGLSNEEIARRLGVTKETVYSHKSRARKQLEDLLRFFSILMLIQ